MKSSKQIWLTSCAVGIAIVVIGYLYFSKQSTNDCGQDCEVVGFSQQSEDFAQSASKKVLKQNMNSQDDTSADRQLTASNSAQQIDLTHKESVKKHYDDDWCFAKRELSESDYQFAQTELKDWERLIGKARAGNSDMAGRDEISFPNNSFLESYETMPLEELQALALQGDKWAMVAYLQDSRPGFKQGRKFKFKFANELLIQGGSYYALEHLVLRTLVDAKAVLRQSNKEVAIELVTNALAYVYWGLEHYNDGGLGPFLAVTSDEFFKEHLPMEEVLPQSVEKISNKLEELTNRIDEQRKAAGIDFPKAPKAVQKLFAGNMATNERLSKQPLELLRSLNIKADSPINSTFCTEQRLARYKY